MCFYLMWLLSVCVCGGGGGCFSQKIGTQRAGAVFHPRNLKNGIGVFPKEFSLTFQARQNDHPRYVKHVLRSIYVVLILCEYWVRGAGFPKASGHNLLMQFFIHGLSNSHLTSLARVLTSHGQGYRLQTMSFCILAGIYYHNIPSHTPQSG